MTVMSSVRFIFALCRTNQLVINFIQSREIWRDFYWHNIAIYYTAVRVTEKKLKVCKYLISYETCFLTLWTIGHFCCNKLIVTMFIENLLRRTWII